MGSSDPVPHPPRKTGSPLLRRGRNRSAAAAIRAHRDEVVSRTTTRFGTDRFPHSPFWLITVDWPNERCPRCERELPTGMQIAFDEDEQACFCFTCARKWLDGHDDDDDALPARPHADHPKTWRPSPTEPF